MAVPTISSVSPSTVQSVGGVMITIAGAGFRVPGEPPDGFLGGDAQKTVSVKIGNPVGVDTPDAFDIKVWDATEVTCMVPAYAGAAGTPGAFPAYDVRVANLDDDELEIAGENVTAADALTYVRPVLDDPNDDAVRIVREVVQLFKRHVYPNTVLTVHTDFGTGVAGEYGELATLPGIVLMGPLMPRNRMYQDEQQHTSDPDDDGRVKEYRPGDTYDLRFSFVGVAELATTLLAMVRAVETLFTNIKHVEIYRDPMDTTKGKVRYELDKVGDVDVASRTTENNVRYFEGSFVVVGFEFEGGQVDQTYTTDPDNEIGVTYERI